MPGSESSFLCNLRREILTMKCVIPKAGFVFVAGLFFIHDSRAQTSLDAIFARSLATSQHRHQVKIVQTRKKGYLLRGPYLFYKYFISSQDGHACSFHPSCANYAFGAVTEKGLFPGILITFDRLTRCNGMNREDYEWHMETGRIYDPYPLRRSAH
jgi:putative component of membrane protein insertase Oxa1/YidC/SpoIIIJ protein YidD